MKYLISLSLVTCFIACRQVENTGHTSLDTGYQQTPLITETKPSDSLHNMDTTTMIVDSSSNITFDGVPLEKKENSVYNAVYNDWQQAYQKTGHLPLAFKLVQRGIVAMEIRGNIGDALLRAQDDMKNYIARDKFKKKFAELTQAEKDNLQSLHPVLFKRPF